LRGRCLRTNLRKALRQLVELALLALNDPLEVDHT
jgi:hypothetical protein